MNSNIYEVLGLSPNEAKIYEALVEHGDVRHEKGSNAQQRPFSGVLGHKHIPSMSKPRLVAGFFMCVALEKGS